MGTNPKVKRWSSLKKRHWKRFLYLAGIGVVLGACGLGALVFILTRDLPPIFSMKDYKPLLVTEVYSRDGKKIGEFFRERRRLSAYKDIPRQMIEALIAAEDESFFHHGGINYMAIVRAIIANIRAGRKVQGGSTITQQLAKTLFLSPERTYLRKIREVVLAYRLEKQFSKEEILFLYLNQIYFGQGAYGIGTAAKTYFRKAVHQLSLPEMALLAGLPKAPSAFSPVKNPSRAKSRQIYVLTRMEEVGFIDSKVAQEARESPLKVYYKRDFGEAGSFFVETVRQLLFEKLGEKQVLEEGLRVYTSLDFEAQRSAEKRAEEGLRALDKRQGYRGALRQLESPEQIPEFLDESHKKYFREREDFFRIGPRGQVEGPGEFRPFQKRDPGGQVVKTIPPYLQKNQIVEAVVTRVDDVWGLVYVRYAEGQGIIDLETMGWARKPNPEVKYNYESFVKKPSQVLKALDIIQVKLVGERFYSSRLLKQLRQLKKRRGAKYEPPGDLPEFNQWSLLELEQEPNTQVALISYDLKTQDILAMVGGYKFQQSEFNRTIQAKRQTGSSFKVLVYAAALEKGYTPATLVPDSPIVYREQEEPGTGQNVLGDQSGLPPNGFQEKRFPEERFQEKRAWKPHNYTGTFRGDVLFRNALKSSLNVPTVKILDRIGIDWSILFARRMGIFSPLNRDLSLALGSSGVTLYEMTKVFAQFARLGRRIRPVMIHRVHTALNEELLGSISLDLRFEEEVSQLEEEWAQKRAQYLAQKRVQKAGGDGEAGGTGGDSTGTPGGPESAGEAEDSHRGARETLLGARREAEASSSSPFFFASPDQLIRPSTAYLITNILQAAVKEPGGTARRARRLGRDVAGKTGTTNGYYDAWFIGYTPQVATGVWVGYDEEKSIGRGEAGGRAALPLWVNFMEDLHRNKLPERSFSVPPGIVFANIDGKTGKLASATSQEVITQAFLGGTEPQLQARGLAPKEEEIDFFKQDLAE